MSHIKRSCLCLNFTWFESIIVPIPMICGLGRVVCWILPSQFTESLISGITNREILDVCDISVPIRAERWSIKISWRRQQIRNFCCLFRESISECTYECNGLPCLWNFLDLMEISIFSRFDGFAAEPRKGIRSGHVPGSKCIPFPQVNIIFLRLVRPEILLSSL